MRNRADAIEYVVERQGNPYLWGSNGPTGYDCSGLIIAALDIADCRAINLSQKWPMHTDGLPPLGALVYYGRPVSHVMMVTAIWPSGERVVVGACGGGQLTISERDAAERGACVRCSPYRYYRRSERVGWNDPWG